MQIHPVMQVLRFCLKFFGAPGIEANITLYLLTKFIFRKLWLNCVALAILGLGIAPFLVPVLSDMNESAK